MKFGIYFLPTIFTLGNLGLGFYSLLCTLAYRFSAASWTVLAAVALDALDGQVARLTKSNSRFGVEFDSFADLVSFGLAPAVLMYQLVLHNYGRLGFIVALFFIFAGILRLARFNLKSLNNEDMIYFTGLPIPAAAGILVSLVILYEMMENEITAKTIPLVMNNVPFIFKVIPLIMFLLSLLMISRFRYTKFRKFKLLRPKSYRSLPLIIGVLLLIYVYPQNMIFIIFLGYLLSGLADYLFRLYSLRRRGNYSKR
jgi:CDP-diacylglycerol--serine O-phosphatidyltransferase